MDEAPKIVIVDIQKDFISTDGSLNMVTKQNVIDSGIPMVKLSDLKEKVTLSPDWHLLDFFREHCL